MHVSASYRRRVRHHDLLVIGSGSGNSIVDHRFADLDVAMVEHGIFGGTCINVGCVPTKMYVYPADPQAQLPADWVRFAPLAQDPYTVDPARIDASREQWIEQWTDLVVG